MIRKLAPFVAGMKQNTRIVVKSRVRAGGTSINHGARIVVKSRVRAGGFSGNHNARQVRR